MQSINIFWFRRDLRLNDNAGLYHALKSGLPVLPVFIFDENILYKLEDKQDARVNFLHREIKRLNEELIKLGSSIIVKFGKPENIWKEIISDYCVDTVFCNNDYEQYAIQRDKTVENLLLQNGTKLKSFKDQVIFEKREIVKKDGEPYTVFTPYSRKWKEMLYSRISDNEFYSFKSYPTDKYFPNFLKTELFKIPTLQEIGFEPTDIEIPGKEIMQSVVKNYDQNRNFPSVAGTTKLGIHFRFGTISIREKARKAIQLNETFLNELIWRDFYAQILANFPQVEKHSFRSEYDKILWLNNPEDFKAWCEGKTGYPLVDAGMRELNATGFMHNRVRMVVASFLVKHLLIDWRWGEAYFAKKLLDFDLASNSGGWQWAAGCGTDAAPYFRIFNPESQANKFDKEHKYIKKWIKEFGTATYPEPVVDHKYARERCLSTFKMALQSL
jgi:deoxyribodipyrimidine photo-lyase